MSTLELAQREFADLWKQRFGDAAEIRLETGIAENLPAFTVSKSGKILTIKGPSEIEILYGVYDFAEKFLGFCFFEPGVNLLTQSPIAIPEGVLISARAPRLKRRGFIQEFAFDAESEMLADWMVKNKLNYLLTWMKDYDDASTELKTCFQVRGIEIESGHHNFDYWIPGAKYGATNPDFFAVVNGKRISPSGGKSTLLLSEQLCTTNPELRKELAKNIIAYCKAHPELKTISLVPNDGFGWCECPECSRLYDKSRKGDFHSVSRHVYKADRIYHDLIRETAARVRRELPQINITFVAYVNYCAPSDGFELEPNLTVHFAPYWRCINHVLDDPACPVNSGYAADLQQWCNTKRGGEINIYEYYMGVNFYLSLPMLHLEEMFQEMEYYARSGVDGILTQFHISHWNVYGINYYLMGKAARAEDAAASIDFLFDRLFGAAAKTAKDFYRAVKALLLGIGDCHIPYPDSFLRRVEVADLDRLVVLADALFRETGEDNTLAHALTVWTRFLRRFKAISDMAAENRLTYAELEDFRNWIRGFQNERLFVHPKFECYFDRWRDALRPLHFNIDWEDAYIREHRTGILKKRS